MKRRIGIVLLAAVILASGCKSRSADGVTLVNEPAESASFGERAPETAPERESSEVCLETDELYQETAEKLHETEEKIPQTEKITPETAAPALVEDTIEAAESVAVSPASGYITETSHFEGTLIGSDNSASRLELGIDVPFGKDCVVDSNGRVGIRGKDYWEDNSVYAYFADYEYYTEEVLAELLEGYRDEESLQTSEVTKERTDSGEEFYLNIVRFYDDSGFTKLRTIFAEGLYILESGHHMEWTYINRGEWEEDVFLNDAVKSLKSAVFTEYIPTREEADQAELDAILEALIQAGLIQTEFPWRGEVADARTFDEKTTLDLRGSDEPNVLEVTVSGENVRISDMLNVHMLHTDVVGRFGSPIEVSGAEEGAVITFRVDGRNMKNVPMQNLIVLHYNEEDAWYDELPSKVDETKKTVSAQIVGDGCYLLADLYEWYGVWGFPIPEGSEHPIISYSKTSEDN